MRAGWNAEMLGNLCEIELGRTPARANREYWDERRETTNVWLSIADLLNAKNKIVCDSKEYLSNKGAATCNLVRMGTLLVSFKLTLGRLAFAGQDLYTNEAIAALIPFDEKVLSKEFLFYYFTYFDWKEAAGSDEKIKGVTLNKAKLKQLVVHFPSLDEQVSIVSQLDDLTTETRRLESLYQRKLAALQELKQSLLHRVFTGAL